MTSVRAPFAPVPVPAPAPAPVSSPVPVPSAPPAAVAPAVANVQNSYQGEEQEDYDEENDDDDVGDNARMSQSRMFTVAMSVVGGILAVVAIIGMIWAFAYKSTATTNTAGGSLDIVQTSSTDVKNTSNFNNQNTTITIGGTGTKIGGGGGGGGGNSTSSVTYTVPVRTDGTSRFLWTLAAILGIVFLVLLGASSYYRSQRRVRTQGRAY
jgi:cobalamin biosynthesis Mg chelatase CobN